MSSKKKKSKKKKPKPRAKKRSLRTSGRGPLASKVLREYRRLERSNVLSLDAARSARDIDRQLAEVEAADEFPPDHLAWMKLFRVFTQLAAQLLQLDSLHELESRIHEAELKYTPGDSMVRDSVFTTWFMADLTIGIEKETLCTILIDLANELGLLSDQVDALRALRDSRFGIDNCEVIGPHRVLLRDFSVPEDVESELPKGLTGRYSSWFVRLLPPILPGSTTWTTWTTPYHLTAGDDAWAEYLEVVAGPMIEEQVAYMRRPPTVDFWLDFIHTSAHEGPNGTFEIDYLPEDFDDYLDDERVTEEEVIEVLSRAPLRFMKEALDERIPQLGDQTPRELVRTESGAALVREWLLQQEEAFSHPDLKQIDLSEIWEELGLKRP